ncbi:MAG: GNAT family N-acetyltransferase [Pseudomonadota bacterium]
MTNPSSIDAAQASSSGLTIRRATPADCAVLTDIALRSKAHWGYDDAFMAACVDELTVTPETLTAGETWVAEMPDGTLAGFCDVRLDDGVAEVYAAFVDPPFIGTGVGAKLWAKVEEVTRQLGTSTIGVDSDPQAQGFYERMGCVVTGTTPSASIAGRSLPRLVKELA